MNAWWGYLHENETIQVKRFLSFCDIKDALESPFVKKVTSPFNAENREDALKKAESRLKSAKE